MNLSMCVRDGYDNACGRCMLEKCERMLHACNDDEVRSVSEAAWEGCPCVSLWLPCCYKETQ